MTPPLKDGPWSLGCNSVVEPSNVPDGQYQWLVNGTNRGGIPQTRPGFNCIPAGYGQARGMTVFTPLNGVANLVVAIGSSVLYIAYPFTGAFTALPGISFNTAGPVVFETTVKNFDEASDGTLTVITPTPILMMSDGQTRTAYWDGTISRHLDPSQNETPIGLWMKWVGSRLWISNGSVLRASNLLDPLLFTEENILSEGGSFSLPDTITGIGVTPDYSTLLVCTSSTTTSFQANIVDRTQWQTTSGFQKEIFPGIGCVGGKSFVNQYGITWWFAQGGMIGLNQAIQTYQTSRIHYIDMNMMRSKANLSPDISGICCGTFENFLTVSVPSGDIHNAHTWLMDQAPRGSLETNPIYSTEVSAWTGIFTGIRPVEWVTTTINGRTRCFVLSQDYNPAALAGLGGIIPTNSEIKISKLGAVNNVSGYTTGATTMIVDSFNGALGIGDTFTLPGDATPYTITAHTETVGNTTSITFAPPLSSAATASDDTIITAQRIAYVENPEGALPSYASLYIYGLTGKLNSGDTFTVQYEAGSPIHTIFSTAETSGNTTQINFSVEMGYTISNPVNVWETFIGERMDIGIDSGGDTHIQDIPCSLETRLVGSDGAYKFFRFAEIDIGEISEVVQLKISFAGKTGGYKQILGTTGKQIIASRGAIEDGVTTITVDTSSITEYRPQSRITRTQSMETVAADNLQQGVESPYTRKKSLAFSLLIEWTGRMAVRATRIFTDPDNQEPEGKVEKDELTDRYVQMDGTEMILSSTPNLVYAGLNKQSTFISPLSQRWIDKPYSSLP
jgi:hypothetical protein